jgi:hypothetical protein
LVKVFNDAIVNVKKRLKILVEDKDIKKQVWFLPQPLKGD